MRRRKNRIRIYIFRAFFGVLSVGMIVLMICGCLYIRDYFVAKKQAEAETLMKEIKPVWVEEQAAVQNQSVEEESETTVKTQYADACVVLDAGHGGNDCGTLCGDVTEKDINLAVALQLRDILEAQGVEVILTRDYDTFMELSERTSVANQSEADLFVSIHCNYFEDDAGISGIECYYYPDAEDGQRCAEMLISRLKENETLTVRNAKPEDYYVLRKTNTAAVLVELGYLSNEDECRKLSSEDYQNTLAVELARAIQSIIINK